MTSRTVGGRSPAEQDGQPSPEELHGQEATDLPGLDRDQRLPVDAVDVVAARELADAERAAAEGGGTGHDNAVLADVAAERDTADRRAIWRRSTA